MASPIEIPARPPSILPPALDAGTLTWSVMIPAFNAGRYLADALGSVLAQDPGVERMQVAVVDDASTDVDVRRVVERVGQGRVEYHRQPTNVGSVRNFNTCLDLARGRLVHLLHADDRVLPGYYAQVERMLALFPDAGAYLTGVRYIDEQGEVSGVEPDCAASMGLLENWLHTCATASRTQYVATAVKRSTYEAVGGYFGVSYGEDWEMQARIAGRFPVAYTPEVLAEYRTHAASISRSKVRSGENLADMAWVVDQIQRYLPADDRARLREEGHRECARLGLHYARQLWRYSGDRAAAERQLEGALRFCDDEATRQQAAELRAAMSGQHSFEAVGE